MESQINRKSIAIYNSDGEFVEIDNNRLSDIVNTAVEYGVAKQGGTKNALAIELGAIWLEGWMAGAEISPVEQQAIYNAIESFYFVY